MKYSQSGYSCGSEKEFPIHFLLYPSPRFSFKYISIFIQVFTFDLLRLKTLEAPFYNYNFKDIKVILIYCTLNQASWYLGGVFPFNIYSGSETSSPKCTQHFALITFSKVWN